MTARNRRRVTSSRLSRAGPQSKIKLDLKQAGSLGAGQRSLIAKVFAPAVVATAEHAHDLAAGVQREGPRIAQKDHVIDLAEHAIAFASIAGMAAGDQVFPGRVTAARTRDYVVQREFAGGQEHAAI